MRSFKYTPKENSVIQKVYPWLGSVLLFPIMLYFYLNISNYLLIDYINLLIHEGGHGVFRLFGDFIYTLGGTLMQIIIPSMFVVYYFINRNNIGTQIFLVWLGQNLFNISVYVADARVQKLPLLGGRKVYHDWTNILTRLELLEYDQLVGNIFVFLGVIMFAVAIITPLLIKKENSVRLNLEL